MRATDWTVITSRPAAAERWASWINARRSFETPALAIVFATLAFFSPVPKEFSAVQMILVGVFTATAFFLWERKGFRDLLSRHETELRRLRDQRGSWD